MDIKNIAPIIHELSIFPFITSSVEETLEEAEDENGIPKTRAQKRKQKEMQVVSSSNTLQPRQELPVSSDTSKEMLSSKTKKVAKNSTETPVKQGKMNMKSYVFVFQ